MNKIIFSFFFIMLLILFSACSDMNDLHDKYLKNGETIYIAKFDSMYVFPGRDRIMVKYWLSDPKAQKCVIKWSLGQDSLVKDIHVTTVENPGSFYIDNLEEGSVSFEFANRDPNFKYSSVKVGYTTNVYGDNYQETLMNVSYKDLQYNSNTSELNFSWSGEYDNSINYQLKYKDISNIEVDTFLSIENRSVLIKKFPANSFFQYRTLYLPEPAAIDTFYTEYRNVVIP